mmetsp:Transcript_4449/g.10721  ORF Transcript_4449/g.10721 Transcript_4449/m.10721 type:complete len:247 (-) Transcript_4449:17-757(-)
MIAVASHYVVGVAEEAGRESPQQVLDLEAASLAVSYQHALLEHNVGHDRSRAPARDLEDTCPSALAVAERELSSVHFDARVIQPEAQLGQPGVSCLSSLLASLSLKPQIVHVAHHRLALPLGSLVVHLCVLCRSHRCCRQSFFLLLRPLKVDPHSLLHLPLRLRQDSSKQLLINPVAEHAREVKHRLPRARPLGPSTLAPQCFFRPALLLEECFQRHLLIALRRLEEKFKRRFVSSHDSPHLSRHG